MNCQQLFRHSGEGRNLVVSTTFWIPAFAGMTDIRLTGQQCYYMGKMNKSWVRWVQALAAIDAVCFFLLYAPEKLYKLGINSYKWVGNDGTILVFFSILALTISCIFVINFVSLSFRKAVIPNQKTITNFYIPYSILVGYVAWGISILFALSQSTDL